MLTMIAVVTIDDGKVERVEFNHEQYTVTTQSDIDEFNRLKKVIDSRVSRFKARKGQK